MSRARVARRIAAAAAVGGGGIGVLGGAAWGVLLTEAKLAQRAIGVTRADAPFADGLYGAEYAAEYAASLGGGLDTAYGLPLGAAAPLSPDGEPLTLVVLGDSLAAGLGVHEPAHTPGALLANGLAAVAERPVRLVVRARPGSTSRDLAGQLPDALAERPDAALILIGANDITHGLRPAAAVALLTEAVRQLGEAGTRVVVGTCPDLGTVEPVKQPLRLVARRLSRHLAAAQTIAVVESGGRTVSMGDLLGPEFAARPRVMFGPDRYHPSAEGYLTAAMAILPALCAGLGMWPDEGVVEPRRGEGVLPVAEAAAEAAQQGGTEVAATGRRHWALLKRRRRRPLFTARSAPANLP